MLKGKNQVDGPSKVRSPEDLSAKVWLALGPDELPQVASLKNVVVYRGPVSAHDHHLWSFRAGKVVDHTLTGDTVHGTIQRPPGLHLFLSGTHTLSALSTGACGACPVHALRVVALDSRGRFQVLLAQEVAEDVPLERMLDAQVEGVRVEMAQDFSRLGFTGTLLRGDEAGAAWKQFWRWDTARRQYVQE